MRFIFNDICYGEHLVLNGGSVLLNKGEITVVTGESGSGKTSLLRRLLSTKDTSLLLSDGRTGCQVSESTQNPLFIESLTIRNHFEQIRELYQKNEGYENSAELLGLTSLLDKYPAQLSGGEQKRADILLCLYAQADLYVLDEPTASLNSEFTEILLRLLKKKKDDGKYLLVFTHDDLLMKQADIHYAIKNKTLVPVTERKETEENVTVDKQWNPDCLVSFFELMRKGEKKHVRIMSAVLTGCIILTALLHTYGAAVLAYQQAVLKEMYSDELVVFKTVPEIDDYWPPGGIKPLDDEEVQQIKETPHVNSVEWRYDTIITGDWDDDLTEEQDPKYKGPSGMWYVEHHTLSFFKDGQPFGKIIMDPVQEYSYLSSHKQQRQIETEFGKEGVYLSSELAGYIRKELHLDSLSDLNGLEIEFEYGVPIYNNFGFWFKNLGNGDMPTYGVTVKRVIVRLPIAGILKYRSFGLPNHYSYTIYINREVTEHLVKEYRKAEDRLLYLEDELNRIVYVNELPEGYQKDKINRVIQETVWRPTAYSVFADEIENIPEIIRHLKDNGFFVCSEYTENKGISEAAGLARSITKYAMILTSLIVILLTTGIQLIGRTREQNTDRYYRHLNLSCSEIRAIREKHYLKSLSKYLKTEGFIYSAVYLIFTCIAHSFLIPAAPVIVLLILTFICRYLEPIFFDRLRKC